jgi:hypothetical protein
MTVVVYEAMTGISAAKGTAAESAEAFQKLAHYVESQ